MPNTYTTVSLFLSMVMRMKVNHDIYQLQWSLSEATIFNRCLGNRNRPTWRPTLYTKREFYLSTGSCLTYYMDFINKQIMCYKWCHFHGFTKNMGLNSITVDLLHIMVNPPPGYNGTKYHDRWWLRSSEIERKGWMTFMRDMSWEHVNIAWNLYYKLNLSLD